MEQLLFIVNDISFCAFPPAQRAGKHGKDIWKCKNYCRLLYLHLCMPYIYAMLAVIVAAIAIAIEVIVVMTNLKKNKKKA